MRDYGMKLGIAFQLADDMLDFTSDAASLGKAAGADLLEGKMTLPFIRLVTERPGFKTLLEDIMISGEYAAGSREEISNEMFKLNLLPQVRELATGYALEARKYLELFPQTEYRDALDEIPNFVIDRNS
jgi:geranylgeranyl pyrophosphate synthase